MKDIKWAGKGHSVKCACVYCNDNDSSVEVSPSEVKALIKEMEESLAKLKQLIRD